MEFDASKIEWLDYDLFEEYSHVIGKTFLRHGGVSKAPFDSLNISDDIGDHLDAVKLNRERIRAFLKLPHLIFAKQMHGTNIVEITKENVKEVHQADVLCTKELNIGLVIAHADCQAAIFYDPQKEVIAVAHAGWKGLVQNIYQKVVFYLTEHFQSKPEDLLVAISPSICPEHAEFKNYKSEIPKDLWSYQTKPSYFDLWKIALDQLNLAQVAKEHIEVAGICTFCEKKDYYSFRRENKTGRHATVAALFPRK